MFRGFLRPGQGFRRYTVLKRMGGLSTNGRPGPERYEPSGEIFGIISQATPKEQEQWKQAGHPVTHKVIQQGTTGRAEPMDVLELAVQDQVRRFLVQGIHAPAELGHFTTYFTEERRDLQ